MYFYTQPNVEVFTVEERNLVPKRFRIIENRFCPHIGPLAEDSMCIHSYAPHGECSRLRDITISSVTWRCCYLRQKNAYLTASGITFPSFELPLCWHCLALCCVGDITPGEPVFAYDMREPWSPDAALLVGMVSYSNYSSLEGSSAACSVSYNFLPWIESVKVYEVLSISNPKFRVGLKSWRNNLWDCGFNSKFFNYSIHC